MTHLDFDHAGGISDFPHATVHVLATEYNAAQLPNFKGKLHIELININNIGTGTLLSINKVKMV